MVRESFLDTIFAKISWMFKLTEVFIHRSSEILFLKLIGGYNG